MTIREHKNLEIQKHMGCMPGFFHIHHFFTGKRFHSAKRLPPPPPVKVKSPDNPKPILSTCGSRKETPRLSLDSRATTDAKGSLRPKDTTDRHGSPTVIARLMGLDPFSPELTRSASESRVSKDLFRSRLLPNAAVFNPPTPSHVPDPLKTAPKGEGLINRGGVDSTSQWRAPPHRKNFFYFGDIFPEQKQTAPIYGEIEKRIGTRGIHEPSRDLEALKQILEALQLKGLLHSKPPSQQQNQIRHRNYVYDENPIVLMKPSRSRASTPINRRIGNHISPANGRNQAGGVRRSFGGARETPPSISPRRERSAQSPTRTGRIPSPTTRTEALAKPKALSVETQRRAHDSPGNRKASPKLNARKAGTDPTASNRLARSKKPTTEIHRKENASNVVVLEDESSSSISGSSIATSTDTERTKGDGIHLLERCDKLLLSRSEISTTDPQPSPVSVLDSSFFKDESSTPSPDGTHRNIGFKDQSGELEEDTWSTPPISTIPSKLIETSYGSDFSYISDILEAVHYLPEGSDIFLILENQQYTKQTDTSKVARLDRKLIFDTIDEILDRNKRSLPWKAIPPSLGKIWPEYERIREQYSGEDMFESICSVLRKDMVGGWGDCPMEVSEAVLDIERLIFKDLICESIGDLAALASRKTLLSCVVPKRKLVF